MDWNNMQTWHYFALVGGGVLVLGVILYFLPTGKVKVPAVVTTGFGALGLGLALGIIFMAGFGYKPYTPEPIEENPSADAGPAAAKDKMGMMMPKGKNGPMGGTPKGGFGGPPGPRVQLAALVTALDNVVDRPVAVNLSPEDRAAIAEQLRGLGDLAEVKDDDAKARLEAIQKVVEKDRKSLETVGYRWPGAPKGGFGGPPKDNPNPFKEGPAADRLKSLIDRLDKK